MRYDLPPLLILEPRCFAIGPHLLASYCGRCEPILTFDWIFPHALRAISQSNHVDMEQGKTRGTSDSDGVR